MANIPTFNNLDLMESVRVQSLNPVIVAVNDLVSKSQNALTLGGTFKANEVPRWDAATKTFSPSGMLAEKGEIHMAPSTLIFGNHEMSSNVENVVFTNTFDKKIYAPLWQDVGPNKASGYVRAYGSVETVVRVPDGNIDVTNPVNQNITIDADSSFTGGTFTLSRNATNVILEVVDTNTKQLVWNQRLGDLGAGQHSVQFKIPLDVKAGYHYDISLRSEDGSPLVAKSNASTGFSWTITRAKWTDKEVALVPDLANVFKDVTLSGNNLTFERFGAGAQPLVLTLPGTGSGTASGDSTRTSYLYKGKQSPNYPNSPRTVYYVVIQEGGPSGIPLPDSATAPSKTGNVAIIRNDKANDRLTVNAPGADTIDGAKYLVLNGQEMAILVRDGTSWREFLKGWVPKDYNTLASLVKAGVLTDPDAIRNAIPEVKTIQALQQQIDALKSSAISRPVYTLDAAAKELIITYSVNGAKSEQVVDLSPLFNNAPPVVNQYKIRFGFVGTKTPTEADVLAAGNQEKDVHRLSGTTVDITRVDKTPKYIFFWKDNNLQDVSSFNFGGFPDKWDHQALTVSGASGTIYISDNQTTSNNITFGVNL